MHRKTLKLCRVNRKDRTVLGGRCCGGPGLSRGRGHDRRPTGDDWSFSGVGSGHGLGGGRGNGRSCWQSDSANPRPLVLGICTGITVFRSISSCVNGARAM